MDRRQMLQRSVRFLRHTRTGAEDESKRLEMDMRRGVGVVGPSAHLQHSQTVSVSNE
jgi:hypothetical protein